MPKIVQKTLRDIVKESHDIFLVKIDKKDKHNKSTWNFFMVDPKWNTTMEHPEDFNDYKFQTVHLRRGNHFFIAYKPYQEDIPMYFVDTRKAMHRNSIQKYVSSLVDYSTYTNDISTTKNEPSFRVTENEMHSNGIDNFLDLCYYYREYSAIGTGYTRNVRNLIVLDIDVDCTKPENQTEIHNLLLTFAKCNTLPDFYIFNHESNHIQLQWLIQNLKYKEINPDIVDNITNELISDSCKNKEVNYRGTDFTKITNMGIEYRRYTRALCDIVKKRKFGDKNYTFWKAKNPMSALMKLYNLELKMPYYSNGEIKYLTQEEMEDLFSSKESRRLYFGEAPEIIDIYKKTYDITHHLVEKVSETKIKKIIDDIDITTVKPAKKSKKDDDKYGRSRNTFVLNCTRITTWDVAREFKYRQPDHIRSLNQFDFMIFKDTILNQVKQKYKEENDKYNGIWPDTTNKSIYSQDEFMKTFNEAFQYAIQNVKGLSYSHEDRLKSIESRHKKKDMKLMAVDWIRLNYPDISRTDLLKKTNRILSNKGLKPITLGSLKRYISESKSLTDDDRKLINKELHP